MSRTRRKNPKSEIIEIERTTEQKTGYDRTGRHTARNLLRTHLYEESLALLPRKHGQQDRARNHRWVMAD